MSDLDTPETRFPGICHLCDEPVAGEEIINHLRLIHPDTYARIPRWPDGKLAIAVTPADIQPFENDKDTP